MPTPDFSKIWASNSPLPEYTFSDADYLTGWDFVGSAPPTKNEFDAWFKLVDTKLNWLYGQLQTTAAKLYPVGSVYISFNPTSPQTLFGGTWTRLKDRVLMAAGDTYAINTTGGSASVTLNVNQLPSHNHSLTANGSHTHSASSANAGNHNHTVSGTIANAGDHTHTWSGSSASAGGHTHTFTGSSALAGNHTHTFTGSSASAGNHTHTFTGSSASAGSHTHTITASTASAGAHTHTRGTMNITGTFGTGSNTPMLYRNDTSGAFYNSGTNGNKYGGSNTENDRTSKVTLDASRNWSGATSSNGAHTHTVTASASSAGAHTHTITGTNAGNGEHNHTISGSNTNAGQHTHTLSGSNTENGEHTHTWSGSIANNGNHNHTISVVENGNHTHTVGNTGGGLPVNTLPPYQTVYMWRRTA